MSEEAKFAQLAHRIAAATARAKDDLRALGMSPEQIVATLMVDATAGAVAYQIPKEKWLAMIAAEYDNSLTLTADA